MLELLGPPALGLVLLLVIATVFLGGPLGRLRRRLPSGSAGFLRGAGLFLAPKALALEPPAAGDAALRAGGADGSWTLRVTWMVRNDGTGPRRLEPAALGIELAGEAFRPAHAEPEDGVDLASRATAELVTSFQLPAAAAERLAAGEAFVASLRFGPEAAPPLAAARMTLSGAGVQGPPVPRP